MSKLVIKNKSRAVIVANLIDDNGSDLFGNTGKILCELNNLFVFERDDGKLFKLHKNEFHDFNTSTKDSPSLNPKYLNKRVPKS